MCKVSPQRMGPAKLILTAVMGLLPLLAMLAALARAAPTDVDQSNWMFIGQVEEDEGGDVMSLSDDVIIEALFTNLDTLQDELEICEEGLRQKLMGEEDDSGMADNDFVHDPDNILDKYIRSGMSDNIPKSSGGRDGINNDISNSNDSTNSTDDINNNSSSSNIRTSSSNANSNISISIIINSSNIRTSISNTSSNISTTSSNSNSSTTYHDMIFPGTTNSTDDMQGKVLDLHSDFAPLLKQGSDDDHSETQPLPTHTGLGLDSDPQTTQSAQGIPDFETLPTNSATMSHHTPVKVVHHHEDKDTDVSNSPQAILSTEQGSLGDEQRRLHRRSSRYQSPTAVVVKRLSQRLETLKRWVIDCHVMYKMLK